MRQPRVFHLLQRAHATLFRAADQHLRSEEGISASQQAVLFVLVKDAGAPTTDIAARLRMSKSSMTGLIDRMVRAGLVRRRSCESDGRVQRVFVTKAGRRIVERSLPDVKTMNQRLLEPFSAPEQDTIARFLEHVADNAHDIVFADRKPARKRA